ncbi:MAG: thiamine pyrophosphate-dependent enzyme, partial [Planctomycetota bacterium]
RRNYEALTSGDGACAGCGEKSVLRSITTVTEAYMRPVFHAKADRLRAKADRLESEGVAALEALATKAPAEHKRFRRAVAHLLMGLGGENLKDIDERMKAHDPISEPNNPHPYPWMNSLFQDGATITWIMGESFIMDHARRSVTPERLADALLEGDRGGITEQQYYELSHLRDTLMTDQEVLELPKAWAVGGDGGMGDIGFQNVSKAILQNRPNVKLLMLDTQVYSNTGGQNSDSSPLPGGYDMNQFGAASQGKLTEKKSLAEIFSAGHGSPLVAQVSMANAAKLYRVILDALAYRGTAFLQCFTTCQPEHGVGDDMATVQAGRIRDSRGMPEFVFNSGLSEIYAEAIDLKGNPSLDEDWWTTRFKKTKQPYRYTVAHWAATEARFRRHFKEITEDQAAGMTHLDDMLVRITQDDVVHHRYLDPDHRAYTPDFEVCIQAEREDNKIVNLALSRQMVLFCTERRKAWRLLQSKAGIVNNAYKAQQALLKKVDEGEIDLERTKELFEEELAALTESPSPVAA